jgi:hypothetical protein
VPRISTKGALLLPDSTDVAQLPRVERARRRIGDHYYDRPEIRRTLVALLLRRITGERGRPRKR